MIGGGEREMWYSTEETLSVTAGDKTLRLTSELGLVDERAGEDLLAAYFLILATTWSSSVAREGAEDSQSRKVEPRMTSRFVSSLKLDVVLGRSDDQCNGDQLAVVEVESSSLGTKAN